MTFKKDMFYKPYDMRNRMDFLKAVNYWKLDPAIMVERYAKSEQRAQVDKWNMARLCSPCALEHFYDLCPDFIPNPPRSINWYDCDIVIDFTMWNWIMEVYNEMLWEYNVPMVEAIQIVPIDALQKKCYPLREASVSSRVYHWMNEYEDGKRSCTNPN